MSGTLRRVVGRMRDVLARAPWTGRIGLGVIAVYVVAAAGAPWLAPYGETDVVAGAFQPWSTEHLLGTDQLGRDLLSRILYGGRNTIGLALLSTLLAFGLGTAAGLLAATLQGWVDQVLSRANDVLMAIPLLIFALLLLTIFGTSIMVLLAVISVLEATRVFRLARAVGMNVVVMDYVEAARLRGEGLAWIIRREVLPNIVAPLVAEFGLRFAFVFLLISALSFLGLGIQPPAADWGSMVRETATLITYGGVTPLLPAVAIALLTVSVNFVVDWFLHANSELDDAG